MKLVNSSEYSDLYSSLLAMMMVAKAETSSSRTRPCSKFNASPFKYFSTNDTKLCPLVWTRQSSKKSLDCVRVWVELAALAFPWHVFLHGDSRIDTVMSMLSS
jgi:hypothetical protein